MGARLCAQRPSGVARQLIGRLGHRGGSTNAARPDGGRHVDRCRNDVFARSAIARVQCRVARGAMHEEEHERAWAVTSVECGDRDALHVDSVAHVDRADQFLLRPDRRAEDASSDGRAVDRADVKGRVQSRGVV